MKFLAEDYYASARNYCVMALHQDRLEDFLPPRSRCLAHFHAIYPSFLGHYDSLPALAAIAQNKGDDLRGRLDFAD